MILVKSTVFTVFLNCTLEVNPSAQEDRFVRSSNCHLSCLVCNAPTNYKLAQISILSHPRLLRAAVDPMTFTDHKFTSCSCRRCTSNITIIYNEAFCSAEFHELLCEQEEQIFSQQASYCETGFACKTCKICSAASADC